MPDMAMPAELKHGKGMGTVTAIDPAKGTITLDHGEITELSWPAMQMGFSAKPEVLAGIKVGDKVDFEIDWNLGYQALGLDASIGQLTQVNLPARGGWLVAREPGKQAMDG